MADNVDPKAGPVNKGEGQAAETLLAQRGRNERVFDMTLPMEMNAVTITAPGGPEVLEVQKVAVPAPVKGQVLVKVAAAGVNRPDIAQRKGVYPPPPGASPLPGLEIAGEIVAVGEGVEKDAMGRQVCSLVAGGGYAEYAIADFGQCLPVPKGLSLIEAGAIPETLMTVWSNLFERAYVVEGDTVLIHGGTSGIGTMAISLCRLFDITSIVTCGSAKKCDAALQWGASHAINYNGEDFVEAVNRITSGAGVDAVLDMVGGDYLPRNLKCLAEDGRHVSIAMMGGAKTSLFIPEVMQRRLTITGSTLRPRSSTFKALLVQELAQNVWPFVESGDLRPALDRTFPLAEAASAHAYMEAGGHIGKIVLTI